MSFFAHLANEQPAYEPPDRVYARVDEVSTDRGDDWTLLDVVDADWLDELGEGTGTLLDPDREEEARVRVSVLAIKRWTERRHEGTIAEIRLGNVSGEPTARHYLTLTSPPIPRAVESTRWLDGPERKRVADHGSIDTLPDTSVEHVREALDLPVPIDAVAVYDVGQGSCNAAIAATVPELYFDLGAGCDANASTFPAAFDSMCFCNRPTIVLSHFHHDHWAAVARFPKALRQRWIVPRQGATLGFSHAVLLGAIRRQGELLIWPKDEDRIATADGSVEVLRCNGKHRNDSGLAMVLHSREGAVLLPGDARYKHIPYRPRHVRSLIVAHHGGRTNARPEEIPIPDGSPTGRLVYSYGAGNTYGHPLEKPAKAHRKIWGPTHLATANRKPNGLGHVHLYASEHAPTVAPPHGTSLAQRSCQR